MADAPACPLPADRPCATVEQLERDMRGLQSCVDSKLARISAVADRLEPMIERLVELRGEQRTDREAIKRIGREVDGHTVELKDHGRRIGDLERDGAVAGVRIGGNERLIWAVLSAILALAGPTLLWWLQR